VQTLPPRLARRQWCPKIQHASRFTGLTHGHPSAQQLTPELWSGSDAIVAIVWPMTYRSLSTRQAALNVRTLPMKVPKSLLESYDGTGEATENPLRSRIRRSRPGAGGLRIAGPANSNHPPVPAPAMPTGCRCHQTRCPKGRSPRRPCSWSEPVLRASSAVEAGCPLRDDAFQPEIGEALRLRHHRSPHALNGIGDRDQARKRRQTARESECRDRPCTQNALLTGPCPSVIRPEFRLTGNCHCRSTNWAKACYVPPMEAHHLAQAEEHVASGIRAIMRASVSLSWT
jgi:hypothetical protein